MIGRSTESPGAARLLHIQIAVDNRLLFCGNKYAAKREMIRDLRGRQLCQANRHRRKLGKSAFYLAHSRLEQDMNRQVEFLFDYGSPFSYLANLQIEGFAKRQGATVIYTPILLGAVLKATVNTSPMTVPAKGRYMATELRR